MYVYIYIYDICVFTYNIARDRRGGSGGGSSGCCEPASRRLAGLGTAIIVSIIITSIIATMIQQC